MANGIATASSILLGKPIPRERPLFWFYHNALDEAKVALIDGGWKILAQLEDPENPGQRLPNIQHVNGANAERFRGARLMNFELYRLDRDPFESRNLATQEADRLTQLREKLAFRYQEVVATQHVWPVVKPSVP